MATLHLKNIPPELISQIKDLASQNNCSIDQQVISLLQNSLKTKPSSPKNQKNQSISEILEQSRHQREKLPTDTQWLDSTELISQDRAR